MNIFNHIKALKIIKLILLLPFIGIAVFMPSTLTYTICIFLFFIILFDFIMIDKIQNDYQHLYHSAYYDSLTGIPNRLSADVFVARNLSPENLSIIMADLDGLKTTNDTFGHQAGDILIKDFSKLFFQAALPDGFAARNGGDEFLAIFSDDGDGIKAREYCKKLQIEIERYNKTAQHPLSYSIGVACGQEFHCESVQSLISSADKQMYLCKTKKKMKRYTASGFHERR